MPYGNDPSHVSPRRRSATPAAYDAGHFEFLDRRLWNSSADGTADRSVRLSGDVAEDEQTPSLIDEVQGPTEKSRHWWSDGKRDELCYCFSACYLFSTSTSASRGRSTCRQDDYEYHRYQTRPRKPPAFQRKRERRVRSLAKDVRRRTIDFHVRRLADARPVPRSSRPRDACAPADRHRLDGERPTRLIAGHMGNPGQHSADGR